MLFLYFTLHYITSSNRACATMFFNELNRAECLISTVELTMKEKSRCSSQVKRPEVGGKRPTHRYWPNSAVESYFTQESGTSDLTERAKCSYLFEDKGYTRNVTGAEGERYECQWSGLDVPRVRGLGLTGRGQSFVGQFPYVHLVGIETVNRLVPPPHIEQLRPQSHNSRPHAPLFPGGHLAAAAPLGKCTVTRAQ